MAETIATGGTPSFEGIAPFIRLHKDDSGLISASIRDANGLQVHIELTAAEWADFAAQIIAFEQPGTVS